MRKGKVVPSHWRSNTLLAKTNTQTNWNSYDVTQFSMDSSSPPTASVFERNLNSTQQRHDVWLTFSIQLIRSNERFNCLEEARDVKIVLTPISNSMHFAIGSKLIRWRVKVTERSHPGQSLLLRLELINERSNDCIASY